MGAPARITPTMRSRKLLALDFIKRYFATWGTSPTLGELAAELGVSNKRAHDLVHQLSDDAMIEIVAGKTRGIRLVERGAELSEADVLVRLRKMGWRIGKGDRMLQPPGDGDAAEAIVVALMKRGLPVLPAIDHDPNPTEVVLRRGPGKGRSSGVGTHEGHIEEPGSTG